MTKQEELLEELRQLYREGKFQDLKRTYSLGKWLLTKEQCEKIERVFGQESNQKSLMDYVVKEMGGKVVDN